MVVAPSLLDLLPADLALELRGLASAAGLDPEAAVIAGLRDYVGLLRSSHEIPPRLLGVEQALARAPVRWVSPPEPVTPVSLPSPYAAVPGTTCLQDVIATVTAEGPLTIRQVMERVARRTGRRLTYRSASQYLRWAVQRSRLRQRGCGLPYEAMHEQPAVAVAEPR